jgi:hypothetical protein
MNGKQFGKQCINIGVVDTKPITSGPADSGRQIQMSLAGVQVA